jgi:general secretion pathway protein I
MMLPSRHQAGFTLLEAIVALVLMSSALGALYTWVNTDLIALRRAEAVIATQNIVQETVRQLQLLPLEDGAGGQLQVSGYTVDWRAKLVEPMAPGRTPRGPIGLYDHSLYEVAFDISAASVELGSWSLRQARYVQARTLQYE